MTDIRIFDFPRDEAPHNDDVVMVDRAGAVSRSVPISVFRTIPVSDDARFAAYDLPFSGAAAKAGDEIDRYSIERAGWKHTGVFKIRAPMLTSSAVTLEIRRAPADTPNTFATLHTLTLPANAYKVKIDVTPYANWAEDDVVALFAVTATPKLQLTMFGRLT